MFKHGTSYTEIRTNQRVSKLVANGCAIPCEKVLVVNLMSVAFLCSYFCLIILLLLLKMYYYYYYNNMHILYNIIIIYYN